MLIKTIIIEDDEKSLYVLQDMIARYTTDLELCGTAGHTDKAVSLIEAHTPQLVFLDVCLANGTGFDVLRQLSYRDFELICITAYDNYALEAFRFSAVDYLLKPAGIDPFEEAVGRVRKRIMEKSRNNSIDKLISHLSQSTVKDKKISIPTQNGYEFVPLSDIVWCKSESSYTIFYLHKQIKIVSSRRLGHYEELLFMNNFCRIHHSIMINMQQVKSYVKGRGGYVVMADGTELEISQRKKGDFLDKLMI